MVEPGTIEDWMLFAGLLGSLSGLAVGIGRWVLRDPVPTKKIRSRPWVAPSGPSQRVSAYRA